MSAIEIPLLRESSTYSKRLMAAVRHFGDSRYHFHRRVNWSHRYGETFYAQEARYFCEGPEAYLASAGEAPAQMVDVYVQHLRPKQVLVVLAKVSAHWLFALLGRPFDARISARGARIYRKCYVDDIELVFDPQEACVVRAVYPFPLNLSRQIRYLRFLLRSGYQFKLAGLPYRTSDLLHFLARRDVRSLMRLESRAQILHAQRVFELGVTTAQLSDEFDIGSLDFARALARFHVRVVNSAHGVGKYLPVHAYQCFFVLTHRQEQYYHATGDCSYQLRSLNDLGTPRPVERSTASRHVVRVVFLSQTFPGLTHIVSDNETAVVTRLNAEFGGDPRVELYYKSHPTRGRGAPPAGFKTLSSLDLVNGLDGTIFVSQFSTCHIDPTFKGRKILVRGHLVHPEIAFDDSEEIVSLDELVSAVQHSAQVNRDFDHTALNDLAVR